MNNDRELLEQAAKAAGIDIDIDEPVNGWYVARYDENGNPDAWWNPLTDDGDALRLAVKLGMCVDCVDGSMMVEFFVKDTIKHIGIEIHTDDPYAATRRAIVRAAAEIGKEQK